MSPGFAAIVEELHRAEIRITDSNNHDKKGASLTWFKASGVADLSSPFQTSSKRLKATLVGVPSS
jgi:hypothetical protein